MQEYKEVLEVGDGEKIEYTPPSQEQVGGDNVVKGVLRTIYSNYDYHFEILFNVQGNLQLQPIRVTNYKDLILEVESHLGDYIAPAIQKQLIATEHPVGDVAPYLLNTAFQHPKFLVRYIQVVRSEDTRLDVEEQKTTLDPEDLAELIRELGYAVVLIPPNKLKRQSRRSVEKKIKKYWGIV